MKSFLLLPLLSLILICPQNAFADEPQTITLSMPPNLVSETCPTPVWKDLAVVWEGVKDERTSPEVGVQTQKNKEPIPLSSNPPLDKVFDGALSKLLSSCGMKFVPKETENALSLSAAIKEFYAGVEKKLVTGKGISKSSIAFTASRSGKMTSVSVGYEIESKKMRSGNIKQLAATLNELFVGTLKQIPATEELRNLK